MQIVDMLLTNKNARPGTKITPRGLVIHWTANEARTLLPTGTISTSQPRKPAPTTLWTIPKRSAAFPKTKWLTTSAPSSTNGRR